MLRGMGLMILGTFLTAYVMVHAGDVWRPSVWGVGTVAWEGRGWGLFGLNAAYHLSTYRI